MWKLLKPLQKNEPKLLIFELNYPWTRMFINIFEKVLFNEITEYLKIIWSKI